MLTTQLGSTTILVDSGRDWTRTNDLTDVNPTNGDRVVYAILLEVESFNK